MAIPLTPQSAPCILHWKNQNETIQNGGKCVYGCEQTKNQSKQTKQQTIKKTQTQTTTQKSVLTELLYLFIVEEKVCKFLLKDVLHYRMNQVKNSNTSDAESQIKYLKIVYCISDARTKQKNRHCC